MRESRDQVNDTVERNRQKSGGADRRQILKIGLLTLAGGAGARSPVLAFDSQRDGDLTKVTSFSATRKYPDSFFPGKLTRSNGNSETSEYSFDGTVAGFIDGSTIVFDTISLAGTLVMGEPLGDVRIVNACPKAIGTIDAVGNYQAVGDFLYTDDSNPPNQPVEMLQTTLSGILFSSTSLQILLQGSGAGVCSSNLKSSCVMAANVA